jgi:hypothetical protein
VLTVERVLTSDGKYPGRAKFADDTVKANAAMLCGKVNALLSELGVASVHVNSGYRDPSVTEGAPNSAHRHGMAVDLRDIGHALSSRITRALLLKHGLRREDDMFTPTWCHLDCRQPYGTIFKP